MPHSCSKTELLGFPVLTGSRRQILDDLLVRFRAGIRTQILTLNPEMVMAAARDAQVEMLLHEAEAVVADGIGIEMAARMLGFTEVTRYPGVDLALDLLKETAGNRVFLLGSRPGVAEQAARSLRQQVPQVNIAGCRDGYFGESEDSAVAGQLEDCGTEILLVGMGSPRQEQFISRARLGCSAKLMMGVGGSLEVFAGVKQRAPLWLQAAGLEWLHRAATDGSRIGRLASLPRFVNLVMREYVGKLNDQVC